MSTHPRAVRRGRLLPATGACALLLTALVWTAGARQRDVEPLIVTGARILDTRSGRYVAGAAVLIENGRIAALLREVPEVLPGNPRRIALPGTTIVPGLGDLHAASSPTAVADADFYYLLALAHGVTFCRGVDMALPWGVRQRERSQSGEVLAPRLLVAGPALDERAAFSFSRRLVADAAAARREVAAQARAGADWIRVCSNTGPDVLRATVAAARAAKVRLSAEPGATSVAELARLGVGLIDRLGPLARNRAETDAMLAGRPDAPKGDADLADDYAWTLVTDADIRTTAALLARRRAVLVPLLGSFRGVLREEALESDPALAFLPASSRDAVQARVYPADSPEARRAAAAVEARGRVVAAMAKAGVRLATGTDSAGRGYPVPGAGVHREMALLVAAGLKPADVIRAATTNAAEALGLGSSVGQIKVGYDADFFVVEGDPLARIEDLLRIRLVVRGGETLDRDELLRQASRAAR